MPLSFQQNLHYMLDHLMRSNKLYTIFLSRHYNMVLTVGIEPTSTVLQTAAMTTSAKLAFFGGQGGIRTHGTL